MADHSAFRTPHSTFRIAVVGGGISGLAAASRLATLSEHDRPLDVTLFEAGDRLGGVIGTRRVGEYLVETGPDMFITNKPAALELCQELGLADQLISPDERHRRSLVLKHGRPVPVPEGFTLLTPT
ncbi:MAG: protoporphyrinogen/coproporphyrinogen oxidase, partial [Planctomycetaceae bacterium]